MFLDEWFKKVGFVGGNPFALKQADEEGDLLQAYFVEHPAYISILNVDQPRSSILHAPRGAGKSTTRRMFEEYCLAHRERLRPLIVRLLDWQPIIDRIPPGSNTHGQAQVNEIFCRAVLALAQDTALPWLTMAHSPDMAEYLWWICGTYDTYLTPSQRRRLIERGWRQSGDTPEIAFYDMRKMPLTQQLEILIQVLRDLGYTTCYVLIDRIDELLETVANWQIAADLLAPLLINLNLAEVQGVAFKYFIPTEVVDVLRERQVLREDRIGCFGLQWDDAEGQALLKKILHSRLSVFSDGQVQSLASISVLELRDIDQQLSVAALGSPRHLLNLGEWLLQACAASADDNQLFIKPEHVRIAQLRLNEWVRRQPVRAPVSVPPTIPRLRLKDDGSIWRGDQPINGWQDLPDLQRSLLQYLYQHQGKLCRKEAIFANVWPNDAVGDDSLRKLVARLTEFIELDPLHPVYLQKVYGGHLRLDHAGGYEKAPDR